MHLQEEVFYNKDILISVQGRVLLFSLENVLKGLILNVDKGKMSAQNKFRLPKTSVTFLGKPGEHIKQDVKSHYGFLELVKRQKLKDRNQWSFLRLRQS